MKRQLVRLMLPLLLVCFGAIATEDKYKFETPEQEALFIQLAEELRCPKCQNQNIADSNAVVAKDLRNKLYELVAAGKDHAEIVEFMKQRYGDFVYYKPPFNAATSILWFGPIFFVVLGVVLIIRRTRTRSAIKVDDAKTEKEIADLLKEEKDL